MWGEVSRRGWKPHLVKELVLDKLLEHRGHRVLADCLKRKAKDAIKLTYQEGKAQARGVVHHGKLHLALQAAHVYALALHPATHGAAGLIDVEAGAIGGASEMTLIAERYHARTDLVAASHSLRLVMVEVCLPFGMQWFQAHWGLQVNSSLLPGARLLEWPGILYLVMATGAGALFMAFIKRNTPWFMGPLVVSMGVTLAGIQWTAIPSEMSNIAQLFIGISLGVRFQREFLQTAPKWLLSVAVGTVGMLLASIAFGWALAWGTGLHPATLILDTSPGGIAEMAITAKVLELGAPVVTAFQVCRLMAVLLIVGPLYRRVELTD